jgi:hypothetical protein
MLRFDVSGVQASALMTSTSALAELTSACGLSDRESDADITGADPVFRTRYRVGETAAAAAAAVGLAAARLWELRTGRRQRSVPGSFTSR